MIAIARASAKSDMEILQSTVLDVSFAAFPALSATVRVRRICYTAMVKPPPTQSTQYAHGEACDVHSIYLATSPSSGSSTGTMQ